MGGIRVRGGLCVAPHFCPKQVVRVDPGDQRGDRGDNEQISGNQFSLHIKGGAKNVSKYDGGEGEDADQSFHCVVHLGN
jgi:hypothetical protein